MSSYPRFQVSRRQLVRGLLATGAFGATSHLSDRLSSQTKAPGAETATPSTSAAPLVMGVIYVGPKDDYGYNQAHAEGAAGWQPARHRGGRGQRA